MTEENRQLQVQLQLQVQVQDGRRKAADAAASHGENKGKTAQRIGAQVSYVNNFNSIQLFYFSKSLKNVHQIQLHIQFMYSNIIGGKRGNPKKAEVCGLKSSLGT